MKKLAKETQKEKVNNEGNAFVKALEEFMYQNGRISGSNWLSYHNDAIVLKSALMNKDIETVKSITEEIERKLKHVSEKEYYLKRALDLDISLAYCAREGFIEGLKFLNEKFPGLMLHSTCNFNGTPDFLCRGGYSYVTGKNEIDAQSFLDYPNSYLCAQLKGHQDCVKYIEQQEDCSKFQEHLGAFKLFNGFQMNESDWSGIFEKQVSFLCLSGKSAIIEELLLSYWALSESFDYKERSTDNLRKYLTRNSSNLVLFNKKWQSSEYFVVNYFLENLNLNECTKEISKRIIVSLMSAQEQNKYMLDVDVAYMSDFKRAQFQSLTSMLNQEQKKMLIILITMLSEKQESIVNKGMNEKDLENVLASEVKDILEEVGKYKNEKSFDLKSALECMLDSCATFLVKSPKFRTNLGASNISNEERLKIVESYDFLKNYNELNDICDNNFDALKGTGVEPVVDIVVLIEKLSKNLIIEDWNLYYLSKLEERLKVFSTGCAILLDKDPQLVIELWQWYQQTQSVALPAELMGALDIGILTNDIKKTGTDKDLPIRQAIKVLTKPLSKGSTLASIMFRGLNSSNSAFDYWTQQWLQECSVSDVLTGRSVALMQAVEFFENPKTAWRNIYRKKLLDWSQHSYSWYKEQIASGRQIDSILKTKSKSKEIEFNIPSYQKTCVAMAHKIINNNNYPVNLNLFEGFNQLINGVLRMEKVLNKEKNIGKNNIYSFSQQLGGSLGNGGGNSSGNNTTNDNDKELKNLLSSLPKRLMEHFNNGGNAVNFNLNSDEFDLLVESSFVNGIPTNSVLNSKQQSVYRGFVSLLQSVKLEKELNGHQKYIKKIKKNTAYVLNKSTPQGAKQGASTQCAPNREEVDLTTNTSCSIGTKAVPNVSETTGQFKNLEAQKSIQEEDKKSAHPVRRVSRL